jgi:type 1 fimbria pilin
MASTFFSNANGTLNNDKAIISPASGVNLAIHMVDSSGAAVAYKQVKVNNPADTHQVSFKSGIATFNFVVSYVRQASAVPVTPGYVKSNTAYTFTYE